MKLLLCLLLCVSLNANGQVKQQFITQEYSTDSADQQRIINFLLEITTQKFFIPDAFSKYSCDLIIEEYFEGKVVKRKSLKDSLPAAAAYVLSIGEKSENGNFPIRMYSQKLDSTLKIYIEIGGLGLHEKLKLKGSAYSWKDVYNLESKKHPLKPNEEFPLCVFTMPVGKEHNKQFPNASEFCLVSGERIPPKDWYKELGIAHFFLFAVKLVE